MRHDPNRKTAQGPRHAAAILRRKKNRDAMRPDGECREDPGVVVKIRTGDNAPRKRPR